MIKSIQIAYDEFFEKKCRIASAAGFRNIALNFHGMKDRSPQAWEKAPDEIRRILSENNLTGVQSHLPWYDLRISSEILDEEIEDAIRNSIKVCGAVGIPWCVAHPRSSITSGFRASQSLKENQTVISGYLDLAAACGTGIGLENLPEFPDIVPQMLFYTCNYEDLCILHDSFRTDNVCICWDTGHANLMHFNQADAIRFIGSRIGCTHIHNNFTHNDDHLPIDNGNIKWDEVIRAFCDICYIGPFTLETHCLYPEDNMLKAFAEYNFAGLCYLEKLSENYEKQT